MEIATAATAAWTEDITVDGDMVPCTISCPGLASGESVAIQFSPDQGANYYTLLEGVARVFNDVINIRGQHAPMSLRFVKGTTAGAVGLYIQTRAQV